MDDKIYAVLTGDIVGSSRLINSNERNEFLHSFKNSFKRVDEIIPQSIKAPFEIYRGDSFQGVLSKPHEALSAALIIRAALRQSSRAKRRRYALDARIAIGVGTIEYLSKGKGSEGDGEAFRLSGPELDVMKKDQRLSIKTPLQRANAEFEVECTLLDAVINKWTAEQARSIIYFIKGWTQEKMANELEISQPAARLRLWRAGSFAIQKAIERYKKLIEDISPRNYNE